MPPGEGGRVGPIVFSNETARSQLVEDGSVVTFRTGKRTTGRTHWRTSRTGTKRGDVVVGEIGAIDPTGDALRAYVGLSGFETVEAWRSAIRDLHGDVPESGYLYLAVAVG